MPLAKYSEFPFKRYCNLNSKELEVLLKEKNILSFHEVHLFSCRSVDAMVSF